MTDASGIKIKHPRPSIPVLSNGRPARRTVVITPSWHYFDAFCHYSRINPRDRNVKWAWGDQSVRGLGYYDLDVVLYDTSLSWLPRPVRYWFDAWSQLNIDGKVYSLGEACMLTPNIVEEPHERTYARDAAHPDGRADLAGARAAAGLPERRRGRAVQ